MTAATALAPGTRLAHYVLGKPLGTGGMGTVYEARDTALDRTVALKVLEPRLAEDASVVARFEREARAAARRNHPNLAHIYFVGAEDGLHYFAMEHVPGLNLEAHVAGNGPQSLAFVADAVVQAARGLAAAHRAGVVHRDVKPSNLMLTPEGDVKVTDFGLAKSLGGDPRITGAGRVMGTPLFMSPEACREQPTDARSDIYSLGLTAWFLLAGRAAYDSGSLGATMAAQLHEPLPSLAELRPDLPPQVDETLARLCAKERAARPATMDEVVRLFEALRPRALHPAPFAARAAALAIDLLCVGTVEAAAIFVVWQVLGWRTFENWIDEVALTAGGFAFLLGVEARWGASLGKRALHLRVTGDGGAPVRFVSHFTRFAIRFPVLLLPTPPSSDTTWLATAWTVQAVAFVVGACWFAGTRGRTLSDAVTRTRVVYDLPQRDGAAA